MSFTTAPQPELLWLLRGWNSLVQQSINMESCLSFSWQRQSNDSYDIDANKASYNTAQSNDSCHQRPKRVIPDNQAFE